MLSIITVKVDRLLQSNIFEFMPLEVIPLSMKVSLLILTVIYMKSSTIVKYYIIILYIPIFNNILSKTKLQIKQRNISTL